jgi:hypothetical protein
MRVRDSNESRTRLELDLARPIFSAQLHSMGYQIKKKEDEKFKMRRWC